MPAVTRKGLIWGRGLVNGDFEPGHLPAMQHGVGNKAIALLDCRRVLIKDVSILEAGHFAVLATGTDSITADGLAIDTNRDGLNFDCCRGVHVRRCRINSPNDDGICLKSTYALGRPVVTEDVLIELGARLRAPAGARPGRLRGVSIRDLACDQLYSSMPMIVSGIPGAMICPPRASSPATSKD